MPNVSYTRSEVQAQLNRWFLVRDCLSGAEAVKARGALYLPVPNRNDTSEENRVRYEDYLRRAVFYNVTRRTLDGLVGQVFSRDPVAELPTSLDVLKADADGAGVSLDQQAKKALSYVMAYGRTGLLVDYPDRPESTSKADMNAGFIRPTIVQFDPWDIINWRTAQVGGRVLLDLLVLQEMYLLTDDGFESKYEAQWRVLRLVNGVYVIEIWRTEKGEPILYDVKVPKVANGDYLHEIPFFFIGSLNNNPEPDHSPLYDLAEINIAHYRNSADYEDSCFMIGQPTPWAAGLNKNWVTEVLKGRVELGSRAFIPLPPNATMGLLQPTPNTMVKEAMDHKERLMVAIGAKLVEQKSVQRTYGEAQLEEASESSILAASAKNVSQAYNAAIRVCGQFTGDDIADDFQSYTLNTDFPASRLTAEELQKLVLIWQSGAIVDSEMRAMMRKAGYATLDDEQYKDEREAEIDTNKGPDLGGPGEE